MGCSNQVEFLKRYAHLVHGPVLEVGSKRYGKSGFDLRTLLPGIKYIGADMETGDGVDVIVDLAVPITETRAILGWAGFNTVICFSTLEHCSRPWIMAENITALLYQGGVLFVSVPFAWKVHNYPADYWRMTPDGVKALFPSLDFEQYPGSFCSEIDGHDVFIKDSGGSGLVEPGYFPSEHHYVIPPLLVNMVGVKR